MVKINIDDRRIIADLVDHLRKTCTNGSNTYSLSVDFGMSTSKLTALFKKITGRTIQQFVKKERIEISKDLLANTSDSLVNISKKVGYKNWSAFSRAFKNITGISPNSYRKKFGNSA